MSEIEPTEQEVTIEAETYPAWADDDEQRRAFVLEAVGSAASEMDAQALGQMILDLSETLRTGAPPIRRKPRSLP
jgi:hypothetical protein